MNKTLVESVIGGTVVLAALVFLYLAYTTARFEAAEGYPLEALFFKVGGLQQGNEVRIGGVKVGTVSSVRIDPETYDTVVRFTVSSKLRLPVDTVAAIAGEGIFGGRYVLLEPGRETAVLKPGDTFERVRDSASLEDLIGEAIF
ncbi:MAG: MlaD family protein [Kiloniellales bacterium]